MAYLQSLPVQAALCCKGVAFGFLLGIVYDLLCLLRALPRKASRWVYWDLGYALLAAVCTFLFLLAVNAGKVRLFMLLSLACGWLVWFFGAGRPFRRMTGRSLRRVERVRCAIRARFAPLFRLPDHLSMRWNSLIKKVVKKSNFLLKLHGHLVYNWKQ